MMDGLKGKVPAQRRPRRGGEGRRERARRSCALGIAIMALAITRRLQSLSPSARQAGVDTDLANLRLGEALAALR